MATELDRIINLRKTAEAAVEDMSDASLRTAAFSIVFEQLLQRSEHKAEKSPAISQPETKRPGNSIMGRILQLKSDNYFNELRSLSDIQSKLAESGWHYPQTMISTPLRRLVQQRHLRRMQSADGSKKFWQYVNP